MNYLLLLSLTILSILSVAESWVSPVSSRVVTVTNVGNSRSTTTTTLLKDVINGNLQWYAGSSNAMGQSATANIVSQDAIDRKLRNAAERFMQFQGGYFSPMRPNDDTANLNRMNQLMNRMGMSENNGMRNDNFFNSGYGNDNGYVNSYDENDTSSILAEDFVFRSPVIGPLTKWDYVESLDYFRVYEAFPDINPNCYGFTVDVIDPLMVRFFVKATGTYQNPLGGFLGSAAAKLTPPDGRQYMGSTEAWSITFNDLDRMQVKSITGGYVVDRFEDKAFCTTKGKGLVYGILNTIGLDYLATAPGSKSLGLTQWLTGRFTKGGEAGTSLFPKASSDPSSIPQWWSDSRVGYEE